MIVRTYRGNQISSMMLQIKQELGDEAVILSTRTIEKGLLEVSVGIDKQQTSGEFASRSPKRAAQHSPMPKRIVGAMEAQGLSPAFIETIAREYLSDADEERALARTLQRCIPCDARLPFQRRIIALIGATGAGKTTTIAKLCAQLQRASGLSIGLIAADSFRVGAVQHLQSYAALMQLPLRVLQPGKPVREELARSIAALQRCDLIFVDTAGCSARDQQRLAQMRDEFVGHDQIERILVLPAPSNAIDLAAATQSFAQVGYSRVIITKLDESGYIGPVISTAMSSGKALSFLTTGQRVPEDIEPASHRRLAWMLTRTLH